ncbi:MAG: hypothetical protein LQ350_001936 [Teloschistes chrysophthalmus]|nr:MAG: hypothetical protein LQ350_001936 [Niorma chrysophthalma]
MTKNCAENHDSTTHLPAAHTPTYSNSSTQTDLITWQTSWTSDTADSGSAIRTGSRTNAPSEASSRSDALEEMADASMIDHSTSPRIFDGLSQVVVAQFNGEDHLALLVTREMVERLDHIGVQNRKLGRLEERLDEAERKAGITSINLNARKEHLEEAQSQDEIDRLRGKIEEEQSTLKQEQESRDNLNKKVMLLRPNVTYVEGLAQDMFRKPFADAGLLKLQDEHDEEENGAGLLKLQDGHDEEENGDQASADGDFPGHQYETDSASSEVSLEELYRRAARAEVRQRHAELVEAEQDFENRHEDFAPVRARYRQEVLEGVCTMSVTCFDQLEIEATQELANVLAAAEEAYEEALARRQQLGPNDWDQESGFLDDGDLYDGYPISWENDVAAAAPTDFIHSWLLDIPEPGVIPDISNLGEGAGYEFDQDEQRVTDDCDIQSVAMSDSFSCCDNTRNRRRIDRWRRITGRIR